MFLGQNIQQQELQQEGLQRKQEGTAQLHDWNVECENLESRRQKKEMQKNEVSVLGFSEVRWKWQGEIRSGDYTVYYTGGEQAEKGVAIVVHKSTVRSVVKKIVYNDTIIAIKL